MKIGDVAYVIVQAGGKGTRLQHLTTNKPKCLLSIDGEPLLYRLFRQFPDSHFIVIADSHLDVLSSYLDMVPPAVPVTVVSAQGVGSLSGMRDAAAHVKEPESTSILLWCDLFLSDDILDLEVSTTPLIGIGDGVRCRWSLDESGLPEEVSSDTSGIVGFFYFPAPSYLENLPLEGEFVQHLRRSETRMTPLLLRGVREFGTLSAVEEYTTGQQTSRFFNRVEIRESEVVKTSRVPEFDHLLQAEANWYEFVSGLGFRNIPELYARTPLTIERIHGISPADLKTDAAHRSAVTTEIMDVLSRLHALGRASADPGALRSTYYDKTVERLQQVQQIIPNICSATLTINGRHCRNPLHPRYEDWLPEVVKAFEPIDFAVIHGDPTFSNMLVSDSRTDAVWLIDPRGTFGGVPFYGDVRYDWAKLLYSLEGNYDQFNRGRFRLTVDGSEVSLSVASNGWDDQVGLLQERISTMRPAVEAIHALIWLSLSGYVRNDVDSVLGAFYRGVYYLEAADS